MRKRGYRSKVSLNFILLIVVLVGLALVLLVNSGFTGNAVKAVKSVVQKTTSGKTISQPACIFTNEICDNLDNDCDKLVDEGGVCIKYTLSPKSPSSSEKYTTFLASSDPPGITDFYGEVKIDGVAAPVGTMVAAITTENVVCGTFQVTIPNPGIGFYGFLHCSCGGDTNSCNGQDIIFGILQNGKTEYKIAKKVGNAIWDQSIKRVDVSINTKCSDGTYFNTCVAGTRNRPKYCNEISANSGKIINNCQACGCPAEIKNPSYPGVGQPKMLNYVCCTGDTSSKGYCFLQNQVRYVNGVLVCPEIRGADTPGGEKI